MSITSSTTAAKASAISAEQVRELIDGPGTVRLVDVRTPGEFAAEHVAGSANVPLDVLREHRGRLQIVHDDAVVLVCASGARAEQAREMLVDAGAVRLEVLRGGLGGWGRDRDDLLRGGGTWAMERQVRLAAGSLVLTGVLASLRWRPAAALAGAIGAGLTFSAVTDTCGMARMLSRLPHNRPAAAPDETSLDALLR